MRYRITERATVVASLIRSLRKGLSVTFLITITICLTIPIEVIAYDEAMAEIVVGSNPPVIFQNQSYSTRTRQNLFHSATAAGSDTEAFAFGGTPQAGIQLAQTSSLTAAGTETGFFNSTATSDIVPPVHIGGGFLGTWIGDPIRTGMPFYSGLMFPQMTRMNPGVSTTQSKGLSTTSTSTTGTSTAGKSDAGGNTTKKNAMMFQPVINNAMNDTLAERSARNATAVAITAANATKQNATEKDVTSKPADIPAEMPSPIIKPDQVFYHQQNKPFSTALTYPSGPFKATPAKIRNTSGFDRFLMNTVARSTTDKAFNGTTSSPTYITPLRALARYLPYEFIQGARGMTMPGTHLNYRAWPL